MLIILIIAAAQEQYTETTQLAGIFSGWITSIVAFYFYAQTHTQLQSQAKTSAYNEGVATQRAQTAERKVNKISAVVTETAKMRALAEGEKAKAAQENIERIKAILQQTDES
jgi:H+/gluconate symporter-like permease